MRGLKTILNLLYPRRCPVCEEIVMPKGEMICKECYKALPFVTEPRCMKCGKPLERTEKEYCYDCEKRTFHYEYGFGLWIYNDIMQRSLAAFKYHGRREYADFYGGQLLRFYRKWIQAVGIQVIVPIPIHKKKLQVRGYNQAELVADIVSKGTGVQMENVLERCVNTMPQKALDNRERIYNLQNAFRLNLENKFCLTGKNVLIIDDIYTTGSTIEVCTNVLLQAGAGKVYFLSLCIGKGF